MRRPTLLASVFSAALAVLPASAQEPAVVVPPIEVVATRMARAPHAVPMSVEVISGADLRLRGVSTLRDALSLATGVAVAPGGDGGPASAVPEFWGLREFDAFLMVVDDIPWGGALNPAIASLSLRDVERVEILRGPAPVTYGATSFVGVIHVVHSAAASDSRYLSVRGGSYGSGAVGLDLPGPVLGKWQTRASGDLERAAFRDDRTEFAKGHLAWRGANIGANGRSWYNLDVNLLRQDPASPHPRQGPTLSSAVPLDANHNPAGAYLDEDRFALTVGHERSAGATGLWTSTLSATRSNQRIFRGFLTDLADQPNNAAGFRENIGITDVYGDTHLMWPVGSRAHVLVGGDVLLARGEAKGATFTYTTPISGSSATAVAEPSVLDKDAEDERTFFGGYGALEWNPVARLSLSGGLRLNATSEKRGEGASSTHTKVSGSVGAIYGLWERGTDHLRVFANYRSTFKPAAFDFGLAENEGVLDPETSMSYEGGIKLGVLDGRLDLEASAFRMDFENLVTPTIINSQPALINSGTTRFQGFEVASDVRVNQTVHARASYSFHDGKFVDFEQDFDGTLTQLAGNRFEMSPRHLFSAGVTVARPDGIMASASVNYTGDRYMNKRNTALAPSFTTFDAGVGYRVGRAEVRIDGRNLGNRRDPVSESEFGDAQYYRMTARTIATSVALRF